MSYIHNKGFLLKRNALNYTQTSGCGFFDLFVNILSAGFYHYEQPIGYFVPLFLNLLPLPSDPFYFDFFNHRKPGHESLNTAGRVLCLLLPMFAKLKFQGGLDQLIVIFRKINKNNVGCLQKIFAKL